MTSQANLPRAISLRGRNALSPFRYDKLMRALAGSVPAISHVYAEYWHFVATAPSAGCERAGTVWRRY